MCTNKSCFVAEVGIFVQGKWIWDVPFRRNFFDWELDIYNNFVTLLNSNFPSIGARDRIYWSFDDSGIFTVKGLCKWVEEKAFEGVSWSVPSQIRKMIPPKICLLFWQGCHNKIACKSNLLRRGVTLGDNGVCSLCLQGSETAEHLFVHCQVSWALWCEIINREGIMWVLPRSLLELADQWEALLAVSDPTLWKLIPYSLVWSLWLGRNDIVFRDKSFNREEVWDLHMLRIVWWVKASWKDCPFSIEQFSSNFCNIRMKRKLSVPRSFSWKPPSLGSLKFNVDGASQGNPGPSGLGGGH